MRNSPSLDVERALGRPVRIDNVALEHDRVVARPREPERSRESRDATPSNDELHLRKLSGQQVGQQAIRNSRNRFRLPTLIARVGMLPMEPGSLVMERKMLRGIQQRAERLAGTDSG
jgi:hypothetical protein